MIAIVAFSWGNHLQPLTVNWVLGKHSSSVLNIFEQATSAALYFQLCLGRPGGTGCMPSSLGSMACRCWTVTQCWEEVYNSTFLYFLQLNSLKSGDDLGLWRTKQRERGERAKMVQSLPVWQGCSWSHWIQTTFGLELLHWLKAKLFNASDDEPTEQIVPRQQRHLSTWRCKVTK